ncbi:hypothetical protein [Cerasicoccus frondis]|uniref:hypothetical protein n=1 Tax=Cerasicoccus frondis TaxID=490090 RepID=UPI002852B314|nr:hypothetical protein [Cerasicoccus frondis]
MFAQVDFSSLTSSMTAEFAGILGLGLGITVAVVGLFAAPQGIKFARRMWESVTDDGASSAPQVGDEIWVQDQEGKPPRKITVDDEWTPY